MRLLACVALWVASLGSAACTKDAPSGALPTTAPSTGVAPSFSFKGIDGRPVSSASLVGRVSVIGFLATYDVHSQAEARYLAQLEKQHSPRVNVVALVLEPPENRPLVEAFVSSLGLSFPVALSDAATIAGDGPFAGLHHVPSIVILDRTGREAFRRLGFLNEAALETAVRAVEAASPPPPEVKADQP